MEADELQVTARMARLSLSGAEENRLRLAVERLLAYCAHLATADVAGLDPTTHPLVKENRLRPDEPVASDLADALLGAAPETEDRFILIPNVL
jgi:aspartyl-tRNA(Asn)/glutamyl-tRNA(Gln) amidotransferase subunit C